MHRIGTSLAFSPVRVTASSVVLSVTPDTEWTSRARSAYSRRLNGLASCHLTLPAKALPARRPSSLATMPIWGVPPAPPAAGLRHFGEAEVGGDPQQCVVDDRLDRQAAPGAPGPFDCQRDEVAATALDQWEPLVQEGEEEPQV